MKTVGMVRVDCVMVGRIATGEVEETPKPKSGRTRSGHAGAKARSKALSPEKRGAIAKKAVSDSRSSSRARNLKTGSWPNGGPLRYRASCSDLWPRPAATPWSSAGCRRANSSAIMISRFRFPHRRRR